MSFPLVPVFLVVVTNAVDVAVVVAVAVAVACEAGDVASAAASFARHLKNVRGTVLRARGLSSLHAPDPGTSGALCSVPGS